MSITAQKSDTKDFLYAIQEKNNLKSSVVIRERKNVLDLKIVVLLDISGSISYENFTKFMLALDSIRGLSMIKVIEFEGDVVAVYDYYKTDQNEVMRLKGGGGTNFVPPFELAKKMNPDAILVLSDLDNYDHVENPNIPTGAIVTFHNQSQRHPWIKIVETLPKDSQDIEKEESAEAKKAVAVDLDEDAKMLDDFKDEPEEEDEEE